MSTNARNMGRPSQFMHNIRTTLPAVSTGNVVNSRINDTIIHCQPAYKHTAALGHHVSQRLFRKYRHYVRRGVHILALHTAVQDKSASPIEGAVTFRLGFRTGAQPSLRLGFRIFKGTEGINIRREGLVHNMNVLLGRLLDLIGQEGLERGGELIMEEATPASLNAVRGERTAVSGKAAVIPRVVVTRSNHRTAGFPKLANQRADTGKNFIALGHTERPAGKEIMLNVNY
mmetsp:Transcript_35164/g.76993  ORF Transcript_35164/g.76993 Transcript_35164/m.76993 type:complete len:230 (-) Transcript_35164:306-995(-)